MLLGGVLLFFVTNDHTRNDIALKMKFQIEQSEQITQLLFQSFDAVNVLVSSNTSITRAFRHITFDESVAYADYKQIQNMNHSIVSIIASSDYIDSVYVYMFGGEKFYSSREGVVSLENSADQDWISLIHGDGGYANRLYVRQVGDMSKPAVPKNVLTIISDMFSGLTQHNGVVVINVDLAKLRKYLRQFSFYEAQHAYLADRYGSVCLTDDSAELDAKAHDMLRAVEGAEYIDVNGERHLVCGIDMERFGWKFISLMPQASINQTQKSVFDAWMLAVVLFLGLSIAISLRIAYKNQANINFILDAFQAAERGDSMPPMGKGRADVYDYIVRGIIRNGILKKYMEVQLSEKMYMQQVLEQSALQYQINPHFLTNTIKTIYWKVVEQEGIASAPACMLENLLDFTGYTLSPPSETVTIREEIEHTKSYVDILQVRHVGEFTMAWAVEENALDAVTCRLILQPYIENAYYHGVRGARGAFAKKILVAIGVEDGQVVIRIEDNGAGMSAELVSNIGRKLKSEEIPEKHIGIYNPHKRIRLRFGGESGVSLRSKEGVGTRVTIRFPYIAQKR